MSKHKSIAGVTLPEQGSDGSCQPGCVPALSVVNGEAIGALHGVDILYSGLFFLPGAAPASQSKAAKVETYHAEGGPKIDPDAWPSWFLTKRGV